MMRTHTEVLVVWLARSPGGSSANVILHSTRPPLEDGRSERTPPREEPFNHIRTYERPNTVDQRVSKTHVLGLQPSPVLGVL